MTDSPRGRLGVLSNLGILSFMQVVVQLVNMGALAYLARTLGQHWFGVVQYGVTIMAFALIFAECGLWSLGIREVARLDDSREVRRYASQHIGLMAVLAAIVVGIGLLVLPQLRICAEDPWIFVLYLGMVVQQIFMLDWVGLGLERMVSTSVVKICRSLFYACFVLLMLKWLSGRADWPAARWVPILLIVGNVISNVIMARRVKHWLGRGVAPNWGGWADGRERLGAALPIGLGNVAVRVLMGVDIVVLGIYFTPDVVGGYSAAVRILVVLIIGIEVLWKALLPRLSRLWRESPAAFGRHLDLTVGLVWVAFVPVAWGGLALGSELMRALFGDAFGSAGPVFRILGFSYVALAMGLFFGNALIASDRQRELLPPRLVAAAIALAGCLVLVPRYGALGACVAMLSSHGLLLVWTGWLCRGLMTRRLLRPFAAALVGGAVMYLVLLWVPAWPVVVLIPFGAAVYALAVGPVLLRWARSGMTAV